jgi:hypothetical protein
MLSRLKLVWKTNLPQVGSQHGVARGCRDLFGGVAQLVAQFVQRHGEVANHLFDQRRMDGVFRFKVVVERAKSDIGLLGDLVDRHACQAPMGHQVQSGPQEAHARVALAFGATG